MSGLRVAALALAAIAMASAAEWPTSLPIYFEDSHVGSFDFFASALDLDTSYALVLIDAHSDASAILRSDEVREQLRRVTSPSQRAERIHRWREDGTVQCFNWIEPLMPRPFADVFWLARGNRQEREKAGVAARLSIDAHEEAEPRDAGPLGGRYHVCSWDELATHIPVGASVAATLDLDTFAALPPAKIAQAVDDVFTKIWKLPRLRALSVALSRPYLVDEAQADALLSAALRNVLQIQNADIHFEPFAPAGPDGSLKAREYLAKGGTVPRFDLAHAGRATLSALMAGRDRLEVNIDPDAWTYFVDQQTLAGGSWRVAVDNEQCATDGFWHLGKSAAPALILEGGDGRAPREVQWQILRPEHASYNVKPDFSLGFAEAAPQWIRLIPRNVARTEGTLPLPFETWSRELVSIGGVRGGAVCVSAKVTAESGEEWETPVVEIRRAAFDGVRGVVTEQFGLPYLYGSTWLKTAKANGPDCGWGADCANFVIAAARRNGWPWDWGNPGQLRGRLTSVAGSAVIDGKDICIDECSGHPVALDRGTLDKGTLIHLGSHVGLLLEDRPPKGILDGGDQVAHQLEDFPRLLTLRDFAGSHGKFEVWRFPPESPESVHLAAAGDIVPGRTSEANLRPSDGRILREADVAVANLEGAIGKKTSRRGGPFVFTAECPDLTVLKALGLDAVSLANNHALDGGVGGMRETLFALRKMDIGAFGAGSDIDAATEPCLIKRKGLTFALFGICFVCPPNTESGEERPGVAGPASLALMERKIAGARRAGQLVGVFAHWGNENTDRISQAQRNLARELVAAGANFVAGSHPHVVQPMDVLAGTPIFFSLGNLLFKNRDGSGYGCGAIGAIEVDPVTRHCGSRLIRLLAVPGDRQPSPSPGINPRVLNAPPSGGSD